MCAKYQVILLDREGYTIAENGCDTLKEAKYRAKLMLSDVYATSAETSHEAWGTDKVEIYDRAGDCIYDRFLN